MSRTAGTKPKKAARRLIARQEHYDRLLKAPGGMEKLRGNKRPGSTKK